MIGRILQAIPPPSNAISAIHNYLNKAGTIDAIVGSFKSAVSKRIHTSEDTPTTINHSTPNPHTN